MKKTAFLGGTCANSTWRDQIIPLLEIDYFNPVVTHWTPECQDEEIRQRESCDFCLYTITPKMLGVYSIAEVIDDSNKRPEKVVFIVLQSDDDSEFDKTQWRSMDMVTRLVQENGGRTFINLNDAAKWLNSQ